MGVEAYAVAICHVPEGKGLAPRLEGTWHTPFWAPHYDDPLSAAHLFAASERERGDFGPYAMWVATGNDVARDIRKDRLMVQMFGEPSRESGGSQ